jgi:hypothetical protein
LRIAHPIIGAKSEAREETEELNHPVIDPSLIKSLGDWAIERLSNQAIEPTSHRTKIFSL